VGAVAEELVKRRYHEPLLIRHEPLRNVTGIISPVKTGNLIPECPKPLLNECEPD
jgi:hypothetical protein